MGYLVKTILTPRSVSLRGVEFFELKIGISRAGAQMGWVSEIKKMLKIL